MSAHRLLRDMFLNGSPADLTDPGASGTIYVDRQFGRVALVSAAAETRTLPVPERAGISLLLYMKTDGGDITLTVTSGYNEAGSTSIVFSATGQYVLFMSVQEGSTYRWRVVNYDGVSGPGLSINGTAVTATAAELNTLSGQTLTTGAGVGITAGTGTVYKNSVQLSGGIYYTSILIDLTGLASSTTDLDVIGVAGGPAHIGRITAAQNGTILAGRMTCLEVPAGGADDIDLYAATEGTGEFDSAIGDLAETAIITAGGAWTLALVKATGADIAANKYLYLTGGEAGTAATYTAGKFLIELFGY
jgi:hypothetical protein